MFLQGKIYANALFSASEELVSSFGFPLIFFISFFKWFLWIAIKRKRFQV